MRPLKFRAIIRIRRRASGWFDWDICDSIGGTITHDTIPCSGMEKSKGNAHKLAGKAAKAFNAIPVEQEAGRPRQQPVCAKSGEYCEAFERGE